MATTYKDLQAKAKSLGLAAGGTFYELQQRIEKAEKEMGNIIPKPLEGSELPESLKSTPAKTPPAEEVPVEALVDLPAKAPEEPNRQPPALTETPKAVATSKTEPMSSGMATKTTTKFIGKWYKLLKGKTFVAPKSVVDTFRKIGLVK
jgi:hypothetical protein